MNLDVTTGSVGGAQGLFTVSKRQHKRNADERYHFFEAIPKKLDALGEGLPELGLDLKRYF